MSWLLERVDDRLVHGQVVVAWGARLRPKRIWVVDDAASPWERDLLAGAAPGIEVKVVTAAEAVDLYAKEHAAAGGAFLLLRDLATALRVVESGAAIRSLNLGGLHYAPGKTKVNEYIYLDDADRATARRLRACGVTLEVQDVPSSRAQSLDTLDPETAAP